MARAGSFLNHESAIGPLLVLLVLLAWLAFTWFQTIKRMARYYTPVPMWDYWRTAAFLHFYQAFDLRVLWQQHNEHRIVFPEIVFAADYLLLHGRQLLPLAISFLCYAGSWLLLARAFGRDAAVPPLVRRIGILLAGIIIGWQGSAVVLADTFLLEWTLLQFAVLVSLALMPRLKETGARTVLVGIIVAAIVATYSSANGLLLWPVLIGAALLLSVDKRQLMALVLSGIVSIAVYFIGYHFTSSLSIGKVLSHPWYSLEFAGAYVSMPFGAIKSTEFGVRLGLISLVMTAIFAVIAFKKGLAASPTGIVLFGWYVFIVLTVFLTAAGRMDPADPAFGSAKAARYLTGPLVTWAVFILLCLWLSARWRWKYAPPYGIAFVIAVLLLIGLPKLRWWLQGADQARARAQLAALAIEVGLQDGNVDLGIFLDPQSVELWSAGLREHHLSVFYDDRSKWLGGPASNLGRLKQSVVPGEITYTFPVLDGVEVAGWVDESRLRQGTGWILLANETGQAVGFGRRLPAGFPNYLENPRTPSAFGWVGFVNLRYRTKYFYAYAMEESGLSPIQGFAAAPEIQVTKWQQQGPQIPGIRWQMDPSWMANNLPRNAFFGQGPTEPFYASWSGGDRNTGRLTSSVFAAPTNGCLIFPVLQGPADGGLTANVVDADTNQAIVSVPFQNTPHQWVFWRLPVTPAAKRLRIVAEDAGKDWGEWLAIGNPSECK